MYVVLRKSVDEMTSPTCIEGGAPKGYAVIPIRAKKSSGASGSSKIGRSASNHELKRAASNQTNQYEYVDAAIDVNAANNPNELPFRKLDKVDYAIDFKTRVNEGTTQLAPMIHEPYVDPAQLRKHTSWHEQLKGSGKSTSTSKTSPSPTTSRRSQSNASSPTRPFRTPPSSGNGTPQRVPISRRPRARSFGDPSNAKTRGRSQSAGESRLPQPKSAMPPSLRGGGGGGGRRGNPAGPHVRAGGGSGGPTEAEIAAIRDVLAATIPQHTNAGAASGISGGSGGARNGTIASGAQSFTTAGDLASEYSIPTNLPVSRVDAPKDASFAQRNAQSSAGPLEADLYSDGEGDSISIDWGKRGGVGGSGGGGSSRKGKAKSSTGGSNKSGGKYPSVGVGARGSARGGAATTPAGDAANEYALPSSSLPSQASSASSRPRSNTMDFRDLIVKLEGLMKTGQKVSCFSLVARCSVFSLRFLVSLFLRFTHPLSSLMLIVAC